MRRHKLLKNSPYEWHVWFAWYPITTVHGVWVWWERVDRKRRGYYAGDVWEYRLYG